MTKVKQKLIERARVLGLAIPDDADFRRLYPGHWQRSAGAWTWCAFDRRGHELMGSCYSITELAKADGVAITPTNANSTTPELVPITNTVEKLLD